MSMTAYMALLAANQPWNLILFMVIPVACAETLVASEFFVLYGKATHGDAASRRSPRSSRSTSVSPRNLLRLPRRVSPRRSRTGN